MVKLKAVDFYKWPVVRSLAPVYAGTMALIFMPLIFHDPLQKAFSDLPWLRKIVDIVPYVGLGYFGFTGLSLFFGWENTLTRRTHKRIEKAMREELKDSSEL
jgi:hypothetical protein